MTSGSEQVPDYPHYHEIPMFVHRIGLSLAIRLLFFSLTQRFNEPIHFAVDLEHRRTAEKVEFIRLYTRQTQRAVIFTDVTSELATVRRAACQ